MTRLLRLLALMGVFSAGSAEAAVVTFDDLAAPGNGTGGLKVGNQYAALGVTFSSFPTALDYSQGTPILPGFAHSGTKAVELCYAIEFCTGPLEMRFTAPQARVKVWVGYTGELTSAQTVVIRGFNAFGQVAQSTATLGPGSGPIPIATPLEVTLSVASITRVTVGFQGAESTPAQIFNNGLAVDDVEFADGPPPPCPATVPPTLSVTSPRDGQVFVANLFTLDASVTSPDPFATMRLDVSAAGASGTFGPFFVSSGHVLVGGITGFLFPGQNTLLVTVNDCRGAAQVSLTVYYRSDVTSTIIHVSDENALDVASAEVYVNRIFRGRTDSAGRLVVSPPLPDGTELLARKFVGESPTYRGNHSAGSFQDWKFRVYITSMPVRDDGSTPQQEVVLEPDPLAPQELRVLRRNTLIGLHVVASLEWDASQAELEDVRNHILGASTFLFNATDGQMLYEQVEVVDDAAFWDDADYRIYGNLSLRSYIDCPRGGFFDDSFWCGSSWIHIPRAPCVGCYSWFSKVPTYVHEFGHYGFGLGDEYSDDDPNTVCTSQLNAGAVPPGPFQAGMPRASCMMFSENIAAKICSSRPENPHVHGTDQGDSSCWHDVVDRFRDGSSPARWILQSPDTRGIIPGQINGGSIPIPAWAPRITISNRPRAGLCAPLSFVATRDDGSRIPGADIWLVTTYGAQILEGQTDTNGEILGTGLHVGDRVGLAGWLGPSFSFDSYTITAADCAPATLADRVQASGALAPSRQLVAAAAAFNLQVALEPTAVEGQLLVRVSAEALTGNKPVKLTADPTVNYTLSGRSQTVLPVRFEPRTRSYVGVICDLSPDAEISLEVTATDLADRTVSRLARLRMAGVDPGMQTIVFSDDGALSLTVPPGGLPAGARALIGPSTARPPALPPGFALVVGPFDVTASVGDGLAQPGTLRFHLPRSTSLPDTSGFDSSTLRILKRSGTSEQWDDLGPGTFLPAPIEKVSLQTERLGTFVLIGQPAPPGAPGGPDVSKAVPTLAQLWPPNHQLVPVGIAGVTSASGPISIVITRVLTDEPTRSKDDCGECPDAFVDGATARLRAERSSHGDGRVYKLYFTASDTSGRSSSSQVSVCVPHDLGSGGCVDDGLNLPAVTCRSRIRRMPGFPDGGE